MNVLVILLRSLTVCVTDRVNIIDGVEMANC